MFLDENGMLAKTRHVWSSAAVVCSYQLGKGIGYIPGTGSRLGGNWLETKTMEFISRLVNLCLILPCQMQVP